MKKTLALLTTMLLLTTSIVFGAPKWGTSVQISGSDAAFWPSLSDDGSTMTWLKLIGLSSDDASSLPIMVAQQVKGKWQAPVTIATNGVKRGIPLAETRPVISGDGKTIVFMGLDAAKNEHRLYEVTKNASGTWSKPAIIASVPTGTFGDTITIDKTGKTVAFLMGDGGFLGGTSILNIIEKVNGTWQDPLKLTTPGYEGGADDPMLSSDGAKIVFLQANANFDIMLSEKKSGLWQEPTVMVKSNDSKSLTSISGDGKTIFYFKSNLKDSIILGYDIYALKLKGNTWGKPVKINPTLIPATLMYDQSISSSEDGNKVVYASFIKKGDSISTSSINLIEYKNGTWLKPVPIIKDTWGMQIFPQMSSDGKLVCYINYQLHVIQFK